MTAYCYDTEFLEDGRTIELISIGIVCADGREYYAVNSDAPMDRIRDHVWLMTNVVPSLPIKGRGSLDKWLSHSRNVHPQPVVRYVDLDRTDAAVKPRRVIANEVRDFLRAADEPELWANYAAYDHVALCQLWGRMIDLPQGIPMYTNDLQQELRRAPRGFVKPQQAGGEHNALEDARYDMQLLAMLRKSFG
jgi:hypothetical protein